MYMPINQKILDAAFSYALQYLNEKEEGNFLFNVFETAGKIRITEFPKLSEQETIELFVDPTEENWETAAIVYCWAPDNVVTSVDFYIYDKTNPKAFYLRKDLREDDSPGVNKIVFKDSDFIVESANPYYVKKPWWKFV